MSSLKTLVIACLCVCAITGQGRAETADLATEVAGCVGRFSAELEHAWLMQDADSEVLARQRAGFVAILEAVMTRNSAQSLLAHRIDTKMAHAELLTLASFGADPTRATWAKRRSSTYKQHCARLLLES